MKFFRAWIVVGFAFLSGGWALRAETTPLTTPLSEGVETTIACELTQPPRILDAPVLLSPKEAGDAKGTYHYKLWLPPGYSADAQKRWPCLFVMAAGGDASMGQMTDYLQSNGFIVVMLVEAKNGPWPPIIGNFLAAHDDVIQRVRIADGQKYATGQSGGARASSVFVGMRPGFGGLVMQSAGVAIDSRGTSLVAILKRRGQIRLALTMGNTDQNQSEVARTTASFPRTRLAVFPFEGGHVWAPAPIFAKAMDWVRAQPPSAGASAPTATGSASPSGTSGGTSFDDFFKKK